MGRVFEKRKHKMFARYAKMAKAFTRIGKEIAIAVKQGGGDPGNNARLRQVLQNAKGLNMPKDRLDSAIKRALSKDTKGYEEVVYEAYAPFGVALLIETATDNTTRTVANIRMHLNKGEGSLGTSGSVSYMFDKKGLIKFPLGNINLDDIELDLIDNGAEDIMVEEGNLYIYTSFEDFGKMTKFLEDKKIEVTSAEVLREPTNTVELTEEQETKVQVLIDRLEEDDDVQNVFHNMR